MWRDKEKAVYSATADTIADWQHARNIKLYTNTRHRLRLGRCRRFRHLRSDLASATEALVCEHLGTTPLRRVGREPKVLLLYRAATEPLNKAATALFVNDAGQTAQLEIMGQGQQIVAHGMHPCGTPYTWGEHSPDDTPLAALPAVTAGQVADLIADAEALFLEHGYRPKGIEPPARPRHPRPAPSLAAQLTPPARSAPSTMRPWPTLADGCRSSSATTHAKIAAAATGCHRPRSAATWKRISASRPRGLSTSASTTWATPISASAPRLIW